jgi:hypothetical protein
VKPSMVEGHQCFGGNCCLQLQYQGSSETSVPVYQATRHHISEDCDRNTHHREDVTSHIGLINIQADFLALNPSFSALKNLSL